MSARTDRDLIRKPYTVPGAVNRRLRQARNWEGLSLDDWVALLVGKGYEVSKSSVSKYEQSMRRRAKDGAKKIPPTMPPFDYLVRVYEVFGYRLEWLAFGEGEPKSPDSPASDDTANRAFEAQLFGELTLLVGDVPWATTPMARMAVLRILNEMKQALDEAARLAPQATSPAHLQRMVQYLATVVPPSDPTFVSLAELSPSEREHVALHVRGLVYLLFRPFRYAKSTFLRTRAATRASTLESIDEDPEHEAWSKATRKKPKRNRKNKRS